jgi:hypothetical protein
MVINKKLSKFGGMIMLKVFNNLTLITITIILSLFLLWGCSSYSFKTDFDADVDFKGYKTYMWYGGEMPDDDALSANPLVKKRVGEGVDKALQAKGYNVGTEDVYDFVVILHAGIREKTEVTSYGYGGYGYGRYGMGWGGYGGYGQTDVYQYDETTLVIDIVDAKLKELVWRGTVTGVVKEYKNQEEQQSNIDRVVTKMLDDFPPDK